MAKFKCVHSGCIYEWLDEGTIKNMREHGEYVEVITTPAPTAPVVKPAKKDKQ